MQLTQNIYQAVQWTVEELCLNYKDDQFYVKEGETCTLYQEPNVGWMTPEAEKIGARAIEILFRFEDSQFKLVTCQAKKPVNLTALKVAVLVTKVLNACMVKDIDYPCAQPASLSGWNFPVIGGWIDTSKLNQYSIRQMSAEITSVSNDFAVGLVCKPEEGDFSKKQFSVGDLVIVKRSAGNHTVTKVMQAISERILQVATDLNEQGQVISYKNVPKCVVRGHWAANELPQRPPSKKIKV